jgi:NhaA family Na+:H+ antiporter
VAFLVLPIFAFANAGVSIAGLAPQDTLHSVSLGIVCGLFFGKQIGVLLSCWLAVRFRVAALPDGINWRELHGLTMLCGIGFTMSIFISTLAFAEGHTSYGGLDRLGILSGSLLSGLLGCAVIRASLNRRSAELR